MASSAMSFSWKTVSPSEEGGKITLWKADYAESENSNNAAITVSYAYTGGSRTEIFYRENRGPNNVPDLLETPISPYDYSAVIATSKPDASGVRQGREVSNTKEFTIIINLYDVTYNRK